MFVKIRKRETPCLLLVLAKSFSFTKATPASGEFGENVLIGRAVMGLCGSSDCGAVVVAINVLVTGDEVVLVGVVATALSIVVSVLGCVDVQALNKTDNSNSVIIV